MKTTTAPKLAPETTTKRGFGTLRCLLCGAEGGISLHLTEIDSVHCHECGDEFSLADLRDVVGRWQKVLQWCESAPALEE